jgi:hypothetical protein
MSNLSVSTFGGASASAPVAPFSGMPGDNSATANTVATLFQQGYDGQATAMLAQAKQGQPPAIQDTLDRMVSSRLSATLNMPCAPSLQGMPQYAYADPVETGNAMRRIDDAGTGRPAMPVTMGLSAEQKFDVYASIVETRGNQAARDALAKGDKVILGLRNEVSTLVNGGKGEYSDRIVVLSRKDGVVQVEEFNRASTQPTAQYDANQKKNVVTPRTPKGEDVTGDGIGELGRLSEGTTEMKITTHPNPSTTAGKTQFVKTFALRPTPAAVRDGVGRVERDSNHDGIFDSKDIRTNFKDDSFKIHAGSRGSTDSAGCTTIYPDDYDRFVSAVTDNSVMGQASWQYVLTATAP